MRIVGQPLAMHKLHKFGKKASINRAIEVDNPDWLLIKSVYEFGETHGYKAALDSFDICKSTYYNYRKLYGRFLVNGNKHRFKSTRPNIVRGNDWDKRVVDYIVELRVLHANLGKAKLKPYVDRFCIKHGVAIRSTGTIQNIINSYPNKLRTVANKKVVRHRKNIVRKPKEYKAKTAGECLSMDSMEFRLGSQKAYMVVGMDEVTKLLFARGTYSHSSRSAKLILQDAQEYLPFDNIEFILTDNGSEFMKVFATYIEDAGITHYHTYPKSPKQNACCERVNRSIQDEFMIKYQNLLFTDLNQFNKQLDKYLRWFNFERVHHKFENKMTTNKKFRELTDCDKMVA